MENATETVKNISSKHRYFAKVEQKAFLDTKGISYQEYLSSDSDSSESDDVVAVEVDLNVQALLPIQETQVETDMEQSETQGGSGMAEFVSFLIAFCALFPLGFACSGHIYLCSGIA